VTTNAYDLSFDDLAERLASWGEPEFRAKQVFDGLWRRAATYDEMTDLPATLRAHLSEELPTRLEVVTERETDGGATRKGLLRLGEGHIVEVVLMAYPHRMTVCVSSQTGCAMGCGFCATGQMGLLNNLTAGEIASQVVWARRAAREDQPEVEKPLTNVVFMGMGDAKDESDNPARRAMNVVFMGMGEPLANERHVFGALRLLTDPSALGIGARHITVSTVGLVPGIERLAKAHPQVGLAVSLHAASDELRSELVPPNDLYNLAALEAAIAEWHRATRRRPSIEWVMIDKTNDTVEQAALLAPIAKRLGAHVNLIPLNPTPGYPVVGSSPARIRHFVRVLEGAGVNVTVRDTRGRDIDAACGQLALEAGPAT
jgi:23S rRNA (adenine2503-C2)-methyltransferase